MPRKKHQPSNRYQSMPMSCGKVRFSHKHDAEQAAVEAMILRPELALRIYKCMNCGGWHLTSIKQVESSKEYT